MRNIGGGKIMAYKLIACDMDETLLNDNHIICQRNIDLIKKSQERVWSKICTSYRKRLFFYSEGLENFRFI